MSNLIQVFVDKDTGDVVLSNHSTPGGGGGPAPAGLLNTYGYVHTQSTPATVWNVLHNANTAHTMTQIFTTTGDLILPDAVHMISLNVIEVRFNSPMAGIARVVVFV